MQYRLPESQKQAAQKQIDEMIECGLLEPAKKSKYNSSFILVKKPNGTYRLGRHTLPCQAARVPARSQPEFDTTSRADGAIPQQVLHTRHRNISVLTRPK
jgi:hypothetical protein